MDFDPFDETRGEAWRAYDEPMVAHVANSAPVRESMPMARWRSASVIVFDLPISFAGAPRWLRPLRTGPPLIA